MLPRLPLKLLRGIRVNRSDLLDSPTEKVIAEGRLILAALSLFAIAFAPALVPEESQAAQVLLFYAAFSLGLLVMRVWRFPQRITGFLVHAVDLSFQIATGILMVGRANPVVDLFALFVLLAA